MHAFQLYATGSIFSPLLKILASLCKQMTWGLALAREEKAGQTVDR